MEFKHLKFKGINMYGWRTRIGLLIPSSNTTMEMEFHQAVPKGVSVHTARMTLPEVTSMKEKTNAIIQMNDEIESAASKLANIEPTIIVYGCTLGSFFEGLRHEIEIIRKIKKSTNISAITVSTAVVNAIKFLGLKRISIATPYVEEINKQEKSFIEKSILGTEVIDIKGLGIIGNIPKGRLDPFSSYKFVKNLDDPKSQGVFISCTNWRTFEIIESLEKDLQKPIVTSNQASLWAALKFAGIREPNINLGTLFAKSY